MTVLLAHPRALALLALLPLALFLRRRGRPPALPLGDIAPARAALSPSLWATLPMACRRALRRVAGGVGAWSVIFHAG